MWALYSWRLRIGCGFACVGLDAQAAAVSFRLLLPIRASFQSTVVYTRNQSRHIHIADCHFFQQEQAKKRTRRTVKQQRGIVGASLDVIKERRSQRPEAREAARKEAIAKGKEKKATSESKKKAEKAKSAAAGARGQPGRIQSKMGSKGVPNKASGKTR